jgi:hypothetical protein
VLRVFLALWLALFVVQTTDLLAAVIPDSCTEETRGTPRDPCDDGCPRCVCCARVTPLIPTLPPMWAAAVAHFELVPPLDPATTPSPPGIFHVPKTR